MKTVDIYSSVAVTLFGILLLTVVIPIWVPVEEGPEFGLSATTMPNVAAVTLTALALAFLVFRVLGRRAQTEEDKKYDRTQPIERHNWFFLLRGTIFLISVTALFEFAGFLVAGPLTVAGFMIMMDERRPLHVAITSVVATTATWLFFWQFLKFPLP